MGVYFMDTSSKYGSNIIYSKLHIIMYIYNRFLNNKRFYMDKLYVIVN